MEPPNAAHPAVPEIAAAVRASLEDLVRAAVQDIWDQVPAYSASNDERLREDVAGHVRAIFEVFLAGLTAGRPTRRSEFSMTREQATRRVAQGITLADFLQAFRIGQITLWHGVLAAAGDDAAAREAALTLVARIMGVIEVGSTVAAEAYVEAQQHAVAESDRLRRDLLEDLLARRASFAGPKRALLRAAGLGPGTPLLVTTAALAGDQADDNALRDAALAVGRTRGGSRGLVVVRQEEIVVVAPVPQGGAAAAVAGLRRACDGLRRRQIALAAGVSTVRTGLSEVADAYAEARIARDSLGAAAGVLALPLLTSLDYLVLRDDETARRLIRPQVRRFVEEDAAAGGALIATLVEFAASDLNAVAAAERLHLHVNTAYYRLDRIAERTGCDLRRLADVMELLIALRLLGAYPPQAARPAATPATEDARGAPG
ncbi:MAG TPA: helix-turn-helix domain-containing protein [Streptosporangiaceae bacterium]|nr:helix-turn-helix domain-containing protein [Streptosporangiaceae bacterium]